MKLSIALCLLLSAVCVSPHMPTFHEFCSHVVANGDGGRPTCDASQCQGRPGKIGPAGPSGSTGLNGLKGQKGGKGTSEELEEKVRILEESLTELKSGILKSLSMKESMCYMGMKSGEIPNSAVSSSSDADGNHAARLGRLDNARVDGQGTWCSRQNRVSEWIQVDLGRQEVLTGVVTQGRPQENHWVTSFKVSCGSSAGNLATIRETGRDKVFNANRDWGTKVVNVFPQRITCRYVRIYPQTYAGHMCMRFDIISGSGMCQDIY